MDSDYNLNSLFSALKKDAKELIETRIKLLKLEVFEKTALVGSFLIYGIIIVNLLFFAFLFAFFALGFLVGKWVNSVAGGFAIVSLLYLLILAMVLIFRKSIFTAFQNLLLKDLNSEPPDEFTA